GCLSGGPCPCQAGLVSVERGGHSGKPRAARRGQLAGFAVMDAPLLLIDAASLYFRAYYGVPESITAPDGTPVNAVGGFTDMLARLIALRRPSRLIACLDLDWRPAFRVNAIASYKAHRVAEQTPAGVPDVEQVPDTLSPQVPLILDVLAAAG